MAQKPAYSLSQIANLLGITRLGVLYWLNRYQLDCYRTDAGAVILSEEQLARLMEVRAVRLVEWQRRRQRKKVDNNGNDNGSGNGSGNGKSIC